MRRAIARWQTAWLWLFVVAVIGAQFVQFGVAVELPVITVFLLLAFVRPPRVEAEPREVAAPLRGTWVGLNSPADRVPSHGTRNFGQTYAMDVLHPSPPGAPTEIAWSPVARRPEEYSCFDEPVHAVAAGQVVAAGNRRRDHLSRDSWPALMYMFVIEAFGRSLGGSGAILGNHVVLDHGEGSFSAYAHLRRGSVAVGPGDTVEPGAVLGRVGNSGNTSEPQPALPADGSAALHRCRRAAVPVDRHRAAGRGDRPDPSRQAGSYRDRTRAARGRAGLHRPRPAGRRLLAASGRRLRC